MQYIPSSEFRQVLRTVNKMQDLPTNIHLSDGNGGKREYPVYYRMHYSATGNLVLEGFAVSTEPAPDLTMINAEEDYVINRCFWAASPSNVYKDYNSTNDKKNGNLVWAATYERELAFQHFYVDLDDPLQTITFSRKQLTRMLADTGNTIKSTVVDPVVEMGTVRKLNVAADTVNTLPPSDASGVTFSTTPKSTAV